MTTTQHTTIQGTGKKFSVFGFVSPAEAAAAAIIYECKEFSCFAILMVERKKGHKL